MLARVVPFALCAIGGLSLGGCGSSDSGLLNGGGGSTPQTALNSPAGSAPTKSARFQIAPIIGSPENVSRDLQAQLATAIGRGGATVSTAPNASGDYVVRGYIVAAREKTNAKISYIWDVTDQSGKRVHRITGEEVAKNGGKDPWAAVNPQVVQAIADKTAKQISNWLPGGSGSAAGSIPVAANTAPASYASPTSPTAGPPPSPQTASTPPPASTAAYQTAAVAPSQPTTPTTGSIEAPVTATVPLVTGAPGDGGTSLTSAIQRELTKGGVSLTSTPGPQTYKVQGKVAMGAGKDGKQSIQIEWSVIDPKGKKLGSVSQKNEVPQGSLDGPWGRTADAAASAATQGIVKLLPTKAVN